MITSLTRTQARAVDRRAIEHHGISALVLMENAGRGAAEVVRALGIRGPVAIGCGKGNNGGDGLVVARWLANLGHTVWTCLFARPDELSAEAAANWRILESMNLPRHVLPSLEEWTGLLGRADWTIDAFFGTGLQGPVRAPFDQLLAACNAGSGQVLALDIPSGLDADTGEPMGTAIRARHTVTFIAPKKGFDNPAARAWTGRVHVIDIGAPLEFPAQAHGA